MTNKTGTEKKYKFEKVCVIGAGYVGLPTATLLAEQGLRVTAVDTEPKVVRSINKGIPTIHEPGLAEKLQSVVDSGKLKATGMAVPSDVFIIAVPTPAYSDGSPNITYVEAAVRGLAPVLKPGNLLIIESTSPVGTTERVADIIRMINKEVRVPIYSKKETSHGTQPNRISIAYCPERVLPGNLFHELSNNARVIGGIDPESTAAAMCFYECFLTSDKLNATDCRTSEMAKLSENTYRDVNIALANELALIAENYGIDPWELIGLANKHPRVELLNPGPGVGGHCIPVDPWFLYHPNKKIARVIKAARDVNDSIPDKVLGRIMRSCRGIDNPIIAVFGLSYKANTDDLRESPSLEIAEKLAAMPRVNILLIDPYINEIPEQLEKFRNVRLVDIETALGKADVAALLVPHSQFKDVRDAFSKFLPDRLTDAIGLLK